MSFLKISKNRQFEGSQNVSELHGKKGKRKKKGVKNEKDTKKGEKREKKGKKVGK